MPMKAARGIIEAILFLTGACILLVIAKPNLLGFVLPEWFRLLPLLIGIVGTLDNLTAVIPAFVVAIEKDRKSVRWSESIDIFEERASLFFQLSGWAALTIFSIYNFSTGVQNVPS